MLFERREQNYSNYNSFVLSKMGRGWGWRVKMMSKKRSKNVDDNFSFSTQILRIAHNEFRTSFWSGLVGS